MRIRCVFNINYSYYCCHNEITIRIIHNYIMYIIIVAIRHYILYTFACITRLLYYYQYL